MKGLYLVPSLVLVVVITIGTIAIYKAREKQESHDEIVSSKIVTIPNFSFRDLYDRTQTLSSADLIGKVSLINIFASWCTTCRIEHKILLQLSAAGIVDMYGIAWKDIDENTIRYLEKNSNPYLKVATDNKGILSDLLSINGIPETFLINRKGEIIYHHSGNLDSYEIEYIEKLTEENS